MTADSVSRAIDLGVRWLRQKQAASGHWESSLAPTDAQYGGDTALVVLALLYAGADPKVEPWFKEAVSWLSQCELEGTYARALRAHVLSRLPASSYRTALERDFTWLINAAWPPGSPTAGAYDYKPPPEKQLTGRWDNSVSQFGVLGIWAAAEAGLSPGSTYWTCVGEHWLRTQNQDGGWGYQSVNAPGGSSGSLTAAGLTSLFVALDHHFVDMPALQSRVGGALERGLAWLAERFDIAQNPDGGGAWKYYWLYGLERVGRASGYKNFGSHEWFREGASHLLAQQRPDGSWPEDNMTAQRNTAFALLFLAHGQAPLLCNKLERATPGARRLRDAAGLTRYCNGALERLLNWQIIAPGAPRSDLLESPLLLISGEDPTPFSDDEVAWVRDFCQRGGLVLGVMSGKNAGTRQTLEDLARRAFPEESLQTVPSTHPIFNGEIQFRINAPPTMLEMRRGLRTIMLLSTTDLSMAWMRYAQKDRNESHLQLGANIYLYAVDKTPPRSRLDTPDIPVSEREPTRTIAIARLAHRGDWDIEPLGWQRFIYSMREALGVQIALVSGQSLSGEMPAEVKIAHLTGSQPLELSEEERAGLRRFLTSGGTLIVDAAGGSRAFAESVREALRRTLEEEPQRVDAASFLITGAGIEGGVPLDAVQYRRAAVPQAAGRRTPMLETWGSRRRFSVIFSPMDLSVGLLGTPVYGLMGYSGDGSLQILRNLVLYADLSAAKKAALHRGESPTP